VNSPDLRIVLGSTTSIEVSFLEESGEDEVFSGTLSAASLALRELLTSAPVWTSSGGTPTLVGNVLTIPISTTGMTAGRYIGQISVTLSSGDFKSEFFDVEVN